MRRAASRERLAPAAALCRSKATGARSTRSLPSLRLTGPLWGAAALAAGLCRRAAAPSRALALRAAAAALSDALAPPARGPPRGAPPTTVAEALAFQPALTPAQDALCAAAAAALCCLAYAATAPPAPSAPYAAAMAVLFAAALALARGAAAEAQHAALLRPERALAAEVGGAAARFLQVDGVELHYTVERPAPAEEGLAGERGGEAERAAAARAATSIHCLHGFGASAYSWSFAQARLAAAARAVVTAHDAPGFGLSARPRAARPYTTAFNAAAAGAILEQEEGGTAANARVLIGHSMGAAAAAEAVISGAAGRVDALVLVAPAIVAAWGWGAPPAAPHRGAAAAAESLALQELEAVDPPGEVPLPGGGAAAAPRRALRAAAAALQAATAAAARLVLALAWPFAVVALRALVRRRSFWTRSLAAAWGDPARGVTPAYVDAYQRGRLVRGWEAGLLRFVAARLGERSAAGVWAAARAAAAGGGAGAHRPQAERLAAAVAARGTRVLIVHGAADRLVPLANSRRLAALLPGAALLEYEACGHMPHEEMAERFAADVAAFVAGP